MQHGRQLGRLKAWVGAPIRNDHQHPGDGLVKGPHARRQAKHGGVDILQARVEVGGTRREGCISQGALQGCFSGRVAKLLVRRIRVFAGKDRAALAALAGGAGGGKGVAQLTLAKRVVKAWDKQACMKRRLADTRRRWQQGTTKLSNSASRMVKRPSSLQSVRARLTNAFGVVASACFHGIADFMASRRVVGSRRGAARVGHASAIALKGPDGAGRAVRGNGGVVAQVGEKGPVKGHNPQAGLSGGDVKMAAHRLDKVNLGMT